MSLLRNLNHESQSASMSRRRFLGMGAGAIGGALLSQALPREAQALPYPIPYKPDQIEKDIQARQTIQRQWALKIANYLNPADSEDGRSVHVEISPAELDVEGPIRSAGNLSIARGMGEQKEQSGDMAYFNLMPAFNDSEAEATYFAGHETDNGFARVWVSASIDPQLASSIIDDSIRGRKLDLNLLQTLASNPETSFEGRFLTYEFADGEPQYDAGGENNQIRFMPVDQLQDMSDMYSRTIRLG